jgi:hypothetical protein
LRDGATELDFFHVKYPQGTGGNLKKHLHLNKENFKKKQAIIEIKNPWDSLCLPRALVVTRLHAPKPKFQTRSGRRNDCGCEKEMYVVLTKNDRP